MTKSVMHCPPISAVHRLSEHPESGQRGGDRHEGSVDGSYARPPWRHRFGMRLRRNQLPQATFGIMITREVIACDQLTVPDRSARHLRPGSGGEAPWPLDPHK